MHLRTILTLATVALATAACSYGQGLCTSGYPPNPDLNAINDCIPDAFQVRYASNLNKGDSIINITNTGSDEGIGDNLCVNVYTFDPSEEMVSCCSCLVTPNALVSLSVQGDLISNTLSPSTPTAVVIKLVTTRPVDGDTVCDPTASNKNSLAFGTRAWGTTLHALPDGTYGLTEGEFQTSGLSFYEGAHLTAFCGFINANGSGFGICKSCRAGGLAGAKQ